MTNLGFLAALGAALCWGTYLVPFKISKSEKLMLFQAVMSVGILLSGLTISLFFKFSLIPNVYGLMAGVLWAIPNALSLIAVSNLGIARAVPVMSSLVILVSFVWGALFFQELPAGLTLGFLGIGVIILGVILVGTTENVSSQNVKKGLVAAILAGLMWGSQFVPVKITSVTPQDYFFSMVVGIFTTAMAISFINRIKFQNKAVLASLLSGAIWTIGNLLAVLAISAIGLARGLPITQLAVLVAVLWGVFYFKEITRRKQKMQALIGALIFISGVITLGFS